MTNIGFEIEKKFFFFGGEFSEEKVKRITREGVRFRVYDASGTCVAQGKFLGDIDALTAFTPIRMAEGDGAIEIRYERGGKFVTL
jgi:hypothetical protein